MKSGLIATIIIQLILIAIAFGHLFSDPNEFMLQNGHDGLKNYYTLQSYVTQDAEAGYLNYKGMNYPIGDVIWYTDNTPPYAMFMRWVHLNITDVTGLIIPLFHFFIVLNFLVFSILTYIVLYRLKINIYLAVLFAVALAWMNPMSLRIFGHFNLSLSFIWPLLVILLLGLFNKVLEGKVLNTYLLLLGVTIVVMSFIHLYYLALIVSLVFPAIVLFAIFYFKKVKAIFFLAVSSLMIGVSTTAVYLTIRLTDSFYHIRPESAQGYNWSEWRIKMQDLCTSYFFLTFKPLGKHTDWFIERFVYLGTAFIFLLLLVLIVFSVYKPFKAAVKERWTNGTKTHFIFIIFLASLFGFFMSQGEKIHFPFTQMSMANIFNPLYYLGMLTDFFTHFRALGRFAWPFCFLLSILLIYTFQFILKITINVWLRVILVFFVSVLITVDTYDYMVFYKKETKKKNLFEAVSIPKLDYKEFQAILPIPFFQVGNENLELTLDDRQIWSQLVFPISIRSGLPLMSAKLSRVPEDHSSLLMDVFSDGRLPSELTKLMKTNKPILIIHRNEDEYFNSTPLLTPEKSKQLININDVNYIITHEGTKYYSWNWVKQ
ncbi:MAG: hypothetical protein HKN92_04650 [Chitinophagales bacterium]|nr:hypothetical protein [Chitinophagales bacterium]